MACFQRAMSEGQPSLMALATTRRKLGLPAGQVLRAIRQWNDARREDQP